MDGALNKTQFAMKLKKKKRSIGKEGTDSTKQKID